MTHDTDDKKLIEACLRGDSESQAALYHRYKAVLFGVCLRYAADREEARDWLQDGFVKIFDDLHQYQPTAPLGAWMRRVVVNTALMHLRQRRLFFKNLEMEDTSHLSDEPEAAPFNEDLAKTLLRMVQQLPDGYRTVFNLHVLDGYTHLEIAGLLGIGEGASKSQLSRAKAMLRALLKKSITT
ncbi:MAG: RNA polymerase sigma factor [Bacteroidetes bacterium]|nr:RNA polymerase sigma factor [Bacteroidota bacterium]